MRADATSLLGLAVRTARYLTGVPMIITVDLIRHGLSDKPQTTHTMNLFTKSIEAEFNHGSVNCVVLVRDRMARERLLK